MGRALASNRVAADHAAAAAHGEQPGLPAWLRYGVACLLVGLGLRDLSMEAAAIPEIKEAIRRLTVEEAVSVASLALGCDSAEAVEEVLARELAPRFVDLLAGLADDPTMSPRSSAPPSPR